MFIIPKSHQCGLFWKNIEKFFWFERFYLTLAWSFLSAAPPTSRMLVCPCIRYRQISQDELSVCLHFSQRIKLNNRSVRFVSCSSEFHIPTLLNGKKAWLLQCEMNAKAITKYIGLLCRTEHNSLLRKKEILPEGRAAIKMITAYRQWPISLSIVYHADRPEVKRISPSSPQASPQAYELPLKPTS